MKTRTFVAGLVLVAALAVSSAAVQVPQMINYQGKLTKPGTCSLDTTVSMTFAIYDDSTGGSALWNETHSAVVVQEGIFNVLLGSVTLIPDSALDGSVQYLGIKVGSDSEMTPRKPIVSVGYAFRSEFSDTADYARNGAADNDWAVNSDTVYRSGGRVAIGTSHPDAKLELEGYIPGDDDATLHLDAIWNPEIFMDAGDVSADCKIHFQTEGTTKWSFVHDGSEDALKFSKTGGGNVLCLSSSARVGVGTISPAYKLDVSGDIRATGTIYGNCDNADKVDGYHAGNSSGQVALSNGTVCTNLNADRVDGYHVSDLDSRYVNESQANSINSSMVVDNSLGQSDIATDGVGASEIASNSVGRADLASTFKAQYVRVNSNNSNEYVWDQDWYDDSRPAIRTTGTAGQLYIDSFGGVSLRIVIKEDGAVVVNTSAYTYTHTASDGKLLEIYVWPYNFTYQWFVHFTGARESNYIGGLVEAGTD